MERAGRVLGKMKQLSDEELVVAAWPNAVGKKIASHTRAAGLVRARLVIEVEDAIWQRQLFTLRGQILAKLEQVAGRPIATEIEFRVTIPRRVPQREETSARLPLDEADGIGDFVLRSVYRAARKRATA
jgi:predicted nucleic acid-binding Zn ribbon protein